MNSWECRKFIVDADHPSVAGHFPGNPIVPGALLLDHALSALALTSPFLIRNVKFLRIVRPGTTLELRWQSLDGGKIHFSCHSAEEVVMTGLLESE